MVLIVLEAVRNKLKIKLFQKLSTSMKIIRLRFSPFFHYLNIDVLISHTGTPS